MHSGILEVGIKIDLCYVSSTGLTDSKKHYVSQLLELGDNNRAEIAMPMENGRIIPVSVGEVYDMHFYTRNGLYVCRAKVVDRFRIQNIFIAVVEFISELSKYQRRQLFRLECMMNLSYRIITEEEVDVRKRESEITNNTSEQAINQIHEKLGRFSSEWKKAVAIDISGGGIKIASSEHIERGKYILVQIPMFADNTIRNMNICAQVIESARKVNRETTFEQRAKFVNLSNADKEFIIRCIFSEERKRRKRENGL